MVKTSKFIVARKPFLPFQVPTPTSRTSQTLPGKLDAIPAENGFQSQAGNGFQSKAENGFQLAENSTASEIIWEAKTPERNEENNGQGKLLITL
jgi:hypothetical protein